MPEPHPNRKATSQLPATAVVELHVAAQRAEFLRVPWPVLVAISIGGVIGAVLRWVIGRSFATRAGAFPWATLAINASGCLLIGFLMVLVTNTFAGRRLLRPFLGVGILGGYTTFSAYIIDSDQLINANAAGIALIYLAGTVVAALCAAAAGIAVARLALGAYRTETETNR